MELRIKLSVQIGRRQPVMFTVVAITEMELIVVWL